ncbi:MAG: hypothetical protein Q9201_005901 [Fulgogasparrea decipioides]
MESRAKLRYRALPLIASPWERECHQGHKQHGTPHGTSDGSSLEKSQSVVSVPEPHSSTPTFREREEASSLELFYDLFFVANLTSFTTVHAIDDKKTISSYIGFFAILWFTWLQVVLYDIRFGVDSLFERVAKLIHFSVMVTFAIVGTRFDPTNPHESYVTMRQLSVVLLVSRLVLICQYSSAMMWVKRHEKIITPLLIHIAAFIIGAVLCLGFFFMFTSESSGQAYIAWYVIIVMEALAAFISSSQWSAVSFVHTNLNERCGLLTLIILGEGIIVLTNSINSVVKGEVFSTSIIAQIISAILIIYCVYMLYFDQCSRTPPSPMRHHFWALAHFPFHTSLILLLEGTSRFITWRNAMEVVNGITHKYLATLMSSNSTTVLAAELGDFAAHQCAKVEADPSKCNITDYLTQLRSASDASSEEALDAAQGIWLNVINATLKFFKIQAARSATASKASDPATSKDPVSDLYDAVDVYDLVFVYFFVAAGLTLIMMAVLVVLGKKGKLGKGDWAAVGLRAVMGSGLALIAAVQRNDALESNLIFSPWMLPTVMLGLFVVVVADGMVGWVVPASKDVREGGGEV